MKIGAWPAVEKDRLFRLALAAIVLAAVAWGSRNLLDAPRPWLDEGIYLQAARHLAETGRFGLVLEPGAESSLAFVTVGYPVLAPVAGAFWLFGASFAVARWVALGFLGWAIAAAGIWIGRGFGRRAGLAAAALVATFPPLFGNGKNLLGEVPGLAYFFTALALLSAWGDPSRRRRPWLLGLFLGLAVAAKPSFLPLLPALACALVACRKDWTWPEFIRASVVGTVAFIAWIATQFGGASLAEIMGHYANPYGLVDVGATMLANVKGFFTHPTPLHFLGLAALAVAGAWKRGGRRIPMGLWLVFGFAALTLASYFRTAGWYRYFFLAHVPLLALAPAMASRFGRRPMAAIVAVLLAVNVFMLARDPNPMFGAHWRGIAAEVQSPGFPDDALYLTAPEIAFFHPTERFRQYLHITDALRIGANVLEEVRTRPPQAIVVGTLPPEGAWILEGFRHVRDFGPYQYWRRATSTAERAGD